MIDLKYLKMSTKDVFELVLVHISSDYLFFNSEIGLHSLYRTMIYMITWFKISEEKLGHYTEFHIWKSQVRDYLLFFGFSSREEQDYKNKKNLEPG